MKVHERIKEYRIKHGLVQKYVAEQSGMSGQRLSAIEKGTLKLSADELENICFNGLKISPAIFFTNQFLENKKISD